MGSTLGVNGAPLSSVDRDTKLRVLDALFGKDSDNEAGSEININFHGVNALPNTVSSSTIDQGYQQSVNRAGIHQLATPSPSDGEALVRDFKHPTLLQLLRKIAKDPKLKYDQKKRLFEVAFDIALSEKRFSGGSITLADLVKVLNKHLKAEKKSVAGKIGKKKKSAEKHDKSKYLSEEKGDISVEVDFLQRFKEETEKGFSWTGEEFDSDSEYYESHEVSSKEDEDESEGGENSESYEESEDEEEDEESQDEADSTASQEEDDKNGKQESEGDEHSDMDEDSNEDEESEGYADSEDEDEIKGEQESEEGN